MTDKKMFNYLCMYLEDALTYEESRSMGLDAFRCYVKNHVFPIPKSELVVGQEYPGHSRYACRATWDGEKFHYTRGELEQTVNHYEDGDENEDVFVPVKEI